MNHFKVGLVKVLFLFIFPGWVCSTHCFSEIEDFFEAEELHGVRHLRRDIKIPVGVADNTLNYTQLPKGTPLHEISSKISQRREEIGLPPEISLEQQDEFFQDFSWKIAKKSVVKSFIPGRVVEIFVHKGQHVEKGDLLCVVECMKMYLTIRSPFPGETTDIFLKEKDAVQFESPLIGLLPTSPEWEEVDREHILDNKDFLISCFPWAMSPPIEILNQEDPLVSSGEENEDQNVFMTDPNPQPIEALEEETPSSSASDSPKEIVLEEIESSSLPSVLQIFLPPEETVIPLQISKEDSLQEEEILGEALLQPIQALEETVAPTFISLIEEKALESQEPIVLPVKGIPVLLRLKSEDDINEEKILMKSLLQPIEVLDETPAPISQFLTEEIKCEEPTILDQQDSIVSLGMTDNTLAKASAQKNSMEQLILDAPKEIMMEEAELSLSFLEILPTEEVVVPLRMDLEEPIQQQETSLKSLISALMDNIPPLIISPFIEEVMPEKKNSMVLPDLQQEAKTLEEQFDNQGANESIPEEEAKNLKFFESLAFPFSHSMQAIAFSFEFFRFFNINLLMGREDTLFYVPLMSSPRKQRSNATLCNKTAFMWAPASARMTPVNRKQGVFTFNEHTLQKIFVSSTKVTLYTPEEKKSFLNHSHNLSKTQPAYYESDLSIYSGVTGIGVILVLCPFLYYRLRRSRLKKLYCNTCFVPNVRYLHAVNANQQRFIIHHAAYDMNLYVDLKTTPLNQNDDWCKRVIIWRIS